MPDGGTDRPVLPVGLSLISMRLCSRRQGLFNQSLAAKRDPDGGMIRCRGRRNPLVDTPNADCTLDPWGLGKARDLETRLFRRLRGCSGALNDLFRARFLACKRTALFDVRYCRLYFATYRPTRAVRVGFPTTGTQPLRLATVMISIGRAMRFRLTIVLPCLIAVLGCGTTKWTDTSRTATEQVLLSDAMDRAVSELDFRALAGKTVFLDPQYVRTAIDRDYLISAMRQHMLASGCILRDKKEEADYIVELRAGAIGTDRHELLYGVPATELPSVISLTGVPRAIPEMPLVKRTEQRGVARIAVFAYNSDTGRPVWQSGAIPVESNARDLWVLGAGPFQRGTIYDGTKFAGDRLKIPMIDPMSGRKDRESFSVADEAYFSEPVEAEEQVADTAEPESTADAKAATSPAQAEKQPKAAAQAQAEAKPEAAAQAEAKPEAAAQAQAEAKPEAVAQAQDEALPKAPKPTQTEPQLQVPQQAAAKDAETVPAGDGEVSPAGYTEAAEEKK